MRFSSVNLRFVRALAAGILLLGAVLRTIQYTAFDESFEMDEFALVLGIAGRDWSELLFRPLKPLLQFLRSRH